jgi:uncharacterized membrane protein YidH (DUF202 family)
LPWAQVSSPNGVAYSVNSMERANDGWVTFCSGVLLIAAAAFATRRLLGPLIAVAGLAAFGFGIENWLNMRQVVEHAKQTLPAPVNASIGLGLWATVITGLVVIALTLWVFGFEHESARRLRVNYG